MDIIKEYSEYSTIQGLIYLFFPYQTKLGKIFWTLVILLMLALGLYWCITAYMNWTNNPVLTTITTTAYSVKNVSTIVSQLLFLQNINMRLKGRLILREIRDHPKVT